MCTVSSVSIPTEGSFLSNNYRLHNVLYTTSECFIYNWKHFKSNYTSCISAANPTVHNTLKLVQIANDIGLTLFYNAN